MKHIHRDIVSVVIFSSDKRILMGKKDPKKGGVYIDCWHIPGGGIEDGEDIVHALTREVKEEVGIDISSYHIRLVDNSQKGTAEKILKETGETVIVDMNFNVYEVTITDKKSQDIKVTLHDDLVEYKWFPLKELRSIQLTPPSIVLFKKMGFL